MLNRMELKKAAKAITKSAQVSAYSVALVYLVIRWLLNAADNFMQASEDTVIYIGGSAIYPYREFFLQPRPLPYGDGGVRVRLGLAAEQRALGGMGAVSPGRAPRPGHAHFHAV